MASRELSILVTAKNMASRVLGQVKGDVRGIDRVGQQASRNLSRNLAIGGAAIAGGLALQVRAGVDSLVELERVENLTAAAIKSTGNVANQSVEGIRARSEAMEAMSGIDDKVLQNAQNLLLTFPQIGEDAFEPTLDAAVNLNAALGGGDEGLQGILLQVAKAVNDPIRGMTALRRSGVSFTKEQQDQVKALVEGNDLMGAQAIVLGELEKQFGGAAEAANKGVGGTQKKFADAIEDMQKALATGFLPLIERVSGKVQEMVANPAFLPAVEEFGESLAGAFDAAINFAEDVPWDAVGSALGTAGAGARMVMDAFLSAPPWLQTAILTGWGLNKLTGGAVGSLIGELGKGLVKGVLGMNAGVVNINAAVVNGAGGGAPGVGGKTGSLGGKLLQGAKVGAALSAIPLVGVAAVEVMNFQNMRNEATGFLEGRLDNLDRNTVADTDRSIAKIQEQLNMERDFLSGILFHTNVRPVLERELAELQTLRGTQREALTGDRLRTSIAQTNSEHSRRAAAAAEITSRKNPVTNVSVSVTPINNISINNWTRVTQSAATSYSTLGGGI